MSKTNTPSLRDIIHRKRAIVDHVLASEHHGAFIFPADDADKIKIVQNLGWLLRHSDDVLHPIQGVAFSVETWRYSDGPSAGGYLPIDRHDPVLIAWLRDGRAYACRWADRSILVQWLDRPSFRGYLVDWHEYGSFDAMPGACTIGGKDYAGISEMIEERSQRTIRERKLEAERNAS